MTDASAADRAASQREGEQAVKENQGRMPAPGPLGRNLIANVERIRAERGLSLNRLSGLLEETGRPVPPLGLSRMIKAGRRVDVDEAAALAAVLGITPDVLLAPPEEAARDPLPEHAAASAARQLTARIEDLLEAAGDPAAREFASGGVDRALRRVQIELEELLAERAGPGAA